MQKIHINLKNINSQKIPRTDTASIYPDSKRTYQEKELDQNVPIIIYEIDSPEIGRDSVPEFYIFNHPSCIKNAILGSIIGYRLYEGRKCDFIFGGLCPNVKRSENRLGINISHDNDDYLLSVAEIEPIKISDLKEDSHYAIMQVSEVYNTFNLLDKLTKEQQELLGIKKTVNYKLQTIDVSYP